MPSSGLQLELKCQGKEATMTVHLYDTVGHVVFTHVENGKTRAWSITLLDRIMKQALDRGYLEPVEAEVDPEWAEYCVQNRGIEEHRLARLSDEALDSPVYGFMEADGSFLMVDGHHRYVYAARMGYPTIKTAIVPKEVMDLVEIEGVPNLNPEAVLNMKSNL